MTAKRAWMEKLGFELEDKGSMVPLWVVVDDCGGERPASLAEIVLWTSLTAPAAPSGDWEAEYIRFKDGDSFPPGTPALKVAFAAGFAHAQSQPIAPELDVTKILLDVVPGEDGQGLEIYAKSVDDVVALLTKQGERIEELETLAAAPVAPADLTHLRRADGTLSGVFIEQPAEPAQASPGERLYTAILDVINAELETLVANRSAQMMGTKL